MFATTRGLLLAGLLLHPLFFCASAVELVLMRMLPVVDYQVHNKSWTNPNSGHPAPSGS